MIILIDISDTGLRPGHVRATQFVAPSMITSAVFIAFFNGDEFYIIKSPWARINVYGKIDDLSELVEYHIARIINK